MNIKHLIIILIGILFSIFSCTEPDYESYTFIIPVDSLLIPDSIVLNDTLEIRFFGTIGNNGCYSFEKFESIEQQTSIQLTAIGKFTGAGVCTCVMVDLEESYFVTPSITGQYYIEVLQPDKTVLRDSVLVIR
ncbi:MAG: hypothetical protein KAW88_04845 [Candidatus Cloacimonetes bacterium]|nr:hypothetical protein [Candidatus Cloacimonadota bacterium]